MMKLPLYERAEVVIRMSPLEWDCLPYHIRQAIEHEALEFRRVDAGIYAVLGWTEWQQVDQVEVDDYTDLVRASRAGEA